MKIKNDRHLPKKCQEFLGSKKKRAKQTNKTNKTNKPNKPNNQTSQKSKQTKEQNGRVIAVGTTSVRALETAFQDVPDKYNGETNLFIYPGYEFKVVDLMITNFHLPKSTLMMLVSAFAGLESIREAYRAAIEKSYRFFSYGDAMFITR